MRRVAILGSTGSIGRNALAVIEAAPDRLRAIGLTAHSRLAQLQQQARQFEPRWVVASDAERSARHAWDLPSQTELLTGAEGVRRLAAHEDVDIVVAAIVGVAGLTGAWAALDAGKPVALANKETLVAGGPLVMKLAAERQVDILPVDSEHSAIFQALQGGRRQDVKRVILTASGGPFREHSLRQLAEVTVDQALAHPTWNMGPKISVDSATMMNKALEIIEARWLFGLSPDQIDVVVHPQSIVHSLVEFCDGSQIAQLGPPDMKLPIQYALSYPQRWPGPAEQLDWTQPRRLDFAPPDHERFPALLLGHEAAREGGSCGAVLNAANEAAVARFLEGRLQFQQIVPACRSVLQHHDFEPRPTLEQLWQLDRWAREEVIRWTA